VLPSFSHTQPFAVTALEHLMLANDWPDCPATFFIRVKLHGSIDRNCFYAALTQALLRHPLFRVKLSGNVYGCTKKLSWIPTSSVELPTVIWGSGQEPLNFTDFTDLRIDLHKEQGIRFFIEPGAKYTWLTCQFHHACTDGLRAARFLEDLMVFYGIDDLSDREGLKRILSPLDQRMLASRGQFHQSWADWLRRLNLDLKELISFVTKRPDNIGWPLGSKQLELPNAQTFPCTVSAELSATYVFALENEAQQKGVTLNDILMRDCVMALLGVDKPNMLSDKLDKLALLVPVSMERKLADYLMPAANISSCYLLNTTRQAARDPAGLLQSVAQQSNHVRQFTLGLAPVRAMRIAGSIPGGMAWLTKPSIFRPRLATAVFSYLGRPLSMSKLRRVDGKLVSGNLVLESIEPVPLIFKHGPYVAFGVVIYGGRLSVTLHYHRGYLSRYDAEDLINAYVKRLKGTASSCVGAVLSSGNARQILAKKANKVMVLG